MKALISTLLLSFFIIGLVGAVQKTDSFKKMGTEHDARKARIVTTNLNPNR